MIDYKAADFWLRFAQVVGYILLGGWVYISNRHKATAREVKAIESKTVAEIKALEIKAIAEIKAMDTKITGLETARNKTCGQHQGRTTALEVKVNELPSHDNLGELHEKVNATKSAVDKLGGVLDGMSTTLKMLLEHHLGEKR